MRTVPRLCEVYIGICLTTEEKALKNISQGSRKKLVGKEYTEQTKYLNTWINLEYISGYLIFLFLIEIVCVNFSGKLHQHSC